jgi:hypothetical protein
MNKIILIILLSIPSLALQAQRVEIRTLMNDALNAIVEKKYDTAKILYQTVLSLNPSKVQEEFARKKIEAINTELGKGVAKVEPKSQLVMQESNKKEVLTPAPVMATGADLAATKKKEESGLHLELSPEVVMDSALTAFSRNDFRKARELFSTILTIKSSPKQQLYAREKIQSIDADLGKTAFKAEAKNPPVEVAKTRELETKKVGVKADIVAAPKPASLVANPVSLNATTATTFNASQNEKTTAASQRNKTTLPIDTTYSTKNSITKAATAVNTASVERDTNLVSGPQEQGNKLIDQNYKLQNSKENIIFAQIVLSEKPSLNLVDSNTNMSLVCQNISSNGKHYFIKFLIQNNNAEDFSIGSTELLHVKNSGSPKKLRGSYFQDLPTVKAKTQTQLVYIVEDPGLIESNEVFMFEMEDTAKKTKLTLNINASIFAGKK